jgi:O-antigen/teichoic acid export membrane protein
VPGPTQAGASPGASPASPKEVGITRGTFLGFRADVVTAISMAAISVGVSRALGPEKRGVFFLAFAAATLISVAGNLGLNTAAIVYAANKEVPLGQIHGVALVFSVLMGALAAVVLLPLEGFWTSTVLVGLDTAMLAMLAAGVPALIYTQVGSAALIGLGRIPAVSWIRIGVQVATAALVIPVAIVTQAPGWTLAAWLAIAVTYALAVGLYLTLRASPPSRPARENVRELVSFAGRGYLGTIAYQGFLRIDLFFLAAMFGPAVVGLYSLSTVIAERISMLGQALYAASAAAIGSSERGPAARLTAQLFRVLLLGLLPSAVVIGLLSIPGFPLVFGDDFAPAVVPFLLLLPGTVCLTLWYPLNLFLVSNLRRPGTTAIIMGCALLGSLPLYYWLIRWLDMSGAAIASSIVYISVLVGSAWVVTRATGLTIPDLVPRRADAHQALAAARSGLRPVAR